LALELGTRQYELENINCKEKKVLYTWHQSLIERPGVTGSMVNCLEMIVKFSVDILNEQDIEVPLHLTWMDGVDGKDSLDENERDWYGLKILFILMCSPRAKDKELKYLDGFITGLEFSLESIISMSVLEIVEKIQNIGMQNKNAYYIQQAFQKIKHVYNSKIPNNAQTLQDNFEGIGMKIASLVVQYVYGTMEVNFIECIDLNSIYVLKLFSITYREFHAIYMLSIGLLNSIGLLIRQFAKLNLFICVYKVGFLTTSGKMSTIQLLCFHS